MMQIKNLARLKKTGSMIFISDILELHQLSTNKYGGAIGVRDIG